jgi:hypothetical protein
MMVIFIELSFMKQNEKRKDNLLGEYSYSQFFCKVVHKYCHELYYDNFPHHASFYKVYMKWVATSKKGP